MKACMTAFYARTSINVLYVSSGYQYVSTPKSNKRKNTAFTDAGVLRIYNFFSFCRINKWTRASEFINSGVHVPS